MRKFFALFATATSLIVLFAGTVAYAMAYYESTFATGMSGSSGGVALVADASGNLYATGLNGVYKITPSGTVSTFATVNSYSNALAFDSSGNLYISDDYAGTVYKVTPGGTETTFASGLSLTYGYMVFDSSGNLYVTGYNSIYKITPAGVVSTFAPANQYPSALAIDPSGNLYVGDWSNTISKITPSGTVSTFATGMSTYPNGPIVVDSSGNLYTRTNSNATSVSKISPTGVITTFASGLQSVESLAFDPSGNLLVAGTCAGAHPACVDIIAPNGTVTAVSGGVTASHPQSIVSDASGNIYVANNSGTVIKLIPVPQPTVAVASSLGSSIQSGQSTTITVTAAPGSGDTVTNTRMNEASNGGSQITEASSTASSVSYAFSTTTAGTYVFYGYAETTDYPSWYNPSGATVTVTVTGAPSCLVSLSPNPAAYSYSGTPVTLSWSFSNATSMYVSNVGYVSTSVGSTSVASQQSTSYACNAGNGTSTSTSPATLTVIAPPSPTATISASSTSVYPNQSTNISADFSAGSGDALAADNIDSPVGTGLGATTNPDASKTIAFSTSTPGTYTFYARATTSYYSSWATYASTTITVTANPSCTVSLSPTTITEGGTSTLSYSSSNATGFSIDNIGSLTPNTSGNIQVSPSQSTDYTGTASVGGVNSQCTASGTTPAGTLTVSCPPTYSCSGNTIQYTNSSCQVSNVQSCVSPAFCQAGSSSCLYPAITFNVSGNYSGNLQLIPNLLQNGETSQVHWSLSNAQSCTVTGSNGNSWTGLSSPAGGATSSPITSETIYTLSCLAYGSNPSVNESATVNVTPTFEEK